MDRSSRCFALVSLLLLASAAFASDERISLDQDAPRIVTATLHGNMLYCQFAFAGDPVVTISGNQIDVASLVVLAPCPPPPPGSPTTFPYSQSVSFGPLADGVYTLTWHSQPGVPPPPFAFQVQVMFSVVNGALVVFSPFATPTLSEWAMLVLALLLAASAARALRRR